MTISDRPWEALGLILLNIVVTGGLLALFLRMMAASWDAAQGRERDGDGPPGPLAGA